MRTACAELGFAEDVLFYERMSALKSEETDSGAKIESN